MTAPAVEESVVLDGGSARGALVVDRFVGGAAFGGLRIVPDLSVDELRLCARSMTLKNGFVRFRVGGAKAGIELPVHAAPDRRRRVAREFGAHFAALIRSGRWRPAVDMGCALDDLAAAHDGAGAPADFSAWRDISHLYTARSLFEATLAALEHRGESPAGRTFAIEGFGKVGMEYARLLAEAGGVLVGLSTRAGGVVRPAGLPVHEMIRQRTTVGDHFVRAPGLGQAVTPAELLAAPADIIAPCARALALGPANRDQVRARIVVCGSNATLDRDTEIALAARGVTVVADFVANCGGVFGSVVERYLDPPDIARVLSERFRPKVRRLLEESSRSGRSLGELAEAEALRVLAAPGSGWQQRAIPVARWLLDRAPRGVARAAIGRWAARSAFAD